jgi:hypothetical protein
MKSSDADECLVHCSECNAYLYAISRFEPKARGQNAILVNCLYQCDSNDEPGAVHSAARREQPYGRA